eukprot:scaffold154276_cov33-Attheya_sp.AAC.2
MNHHRVQFSVARKLSGSAGPGGIDSVGLSHLLLRFGKTSATLREAVADFTRWMANEMPPWASYRAMIASRCVALDKCPGVRPAKCLLVAAGEEAKDACGIDQVYAGLEAGIEGSIHAINKLWGEHEEEEEWGFLLVDATNAFNEGNRMMILWSVRHKWPSGARFTFNCYGHWGILMVRSQNGTALFIFSMEGATQGDPLATFIYGMGLLPLIRRLKREVDDVSQPWYADDAGAGGKFDRIKVYFEKLEEYGPKYGYFPEASKSISIVREHNVERAKEYFAEMKFTIKSGYRYLGGFVGARAEMKEWIGEKADEWTAGIKAIAKVAPQFPQTAYAGIQKSLQQEWQFVLQRLIDGIGGEFSEVEAALMEVFLPALFGETTPAGIHLR